MLGSARDLESHSLVADFMRKYSPDHVSVAPCSQQRSSAAHDSYMTGRRHLRLLAQQCRVQPPQMLRVGVNHPWGCLKLNVDAAFGED